MAEAQSVGIISCGNCMEKEGYIINPLSLPCDHPMCEVCLSGQTPDDAGKIECAVCKVEHVSCHLENLPSAIKGPETFCDTCKRKGVPKKTAYVYCAICKKKYCAKHAEIHDEMNDDHQMIDIRAYQKSSFAETLRHCREHKTEPITIGCKSCWTTLCPLCISSNLMCNSHGTPHAFMALIEIEAELKKHLEPSKQKAEERIDGLSAIVRETTQTLNDWDSETARSVSVLHKARDEQLNAIKAKCTELENSYRSSRDETKEKLSDYKEEADIKLTQLYEKLQSLRSEISNLYVVDLVDRREEIEEGFGVVLSEEYPAIVIDKQMKFSSVEKEMRDIEMKLESADDIIVNPPNQQPTHHLPNRPPPTSIQLIKQVTVGGNPTAVCQYKGYTYVGCDYGAVDRIDEGGQVTVSFIKLTYRVTGIIAHEDRLYMLMYGGGGGPYTVYVHDLTGQQLHSWIHEDRGYCSARALAIIHNELIIADRTNKRFTIYTLTGARVRDVPCDLICTGHLTICHAADNSMLVANVRNTPMLYRVNLTTGDVEWRLNTVSGDIGVVMYSRDYALVTRFDSSKEIKIWTLNINTGEVVREIADPNLRPKSSSVLDTCIDGDTLIIPKYGENTVLYYRLNYDE